MSFINLEESDYDVIIGLARRLTGSKVNKHDHSIIFHNVSVRIDQLKIRSLDDYLAYIDDHPREMSHFISALTIHTTSWFREKGGIFKFDDVMRDRASAGTRPEVFKVLSIGCSTGEEVYSIASCLEIQRSKNPDFNFIVEGWDIDPISLQTATRAVYPKEALANVPEPYKSSVVRERTDGNYVVRDTIKDRCRFRTVNIASPQVTVDEFDYIFCRNMLIYFDQSSTRKICDYILKILRPGGHICVGLSETSALNSSQLISLGQATYATTKHTNSIRIRSQTEPPKSQIVPERILIVDDEPEICELSKESLEQFGIECLVAADAKSALQILQSTPISLILSDYKMPQSSGIDLCKSARNSGFKGGFVLISGYADKALAESALAAGANEIILKPCVHEDLVRLVKSYRPIQKPFTDKESAILQKRSTHSARPDLIVLGASTGGTEVLSRFLQNMPADCPPIMIVQHIAAEFALPFATRLCAAARLKLADMRDNALIEPGTLYLAAGDYHIGVRSDGAKSLRLVIKHDPPIGSHRPSVDFLFKSAAQTDANVFAVIFTGMGKDGANGLLALKESGAMTYAQNEQTCAVFGMPKEAIRLKAALHALTPERIRQELLDSLKRSPVRKRSSA